MIQYSLMTSPNRCHIKLDTLNKRTSTYFYTTSNDTNLMTYNIYYV
jgi:hypothetical protein